MGPLQFNINGTSYTTNKISYEVIDALPNVDEGLWFRKVKTSDSTFCIIIEQRVKAGTKKTATSENSFSLTNVAETDAVVKFKESYSVPGLSGLHGNSYSDFRSIYNDAGEQRQFLFSYTIFHYTIVDKNIPIKFTKEKFDNIPGYYKFEDIVIQ